MASEPPWSSVDIIADWEINTICNFRCRYCFIQRRRGRPSARPDAAGLARGLESTGLTWLVHITGGEPFLEPDFMDLCRELTEANYISVNTNLSTANVSDFAAELDPDRVAFVHCSLHLEQRQSQGSPGGGLEGFVERYGILRSAGFRVFATEVMYPGYIERFQEPFRILDGRGVPVIPKVFRGYIGSKRYPSAYSRQERESITGYFSGLREEDWHRKIHLNPFLDLQLLDSDISYRGMPCAAGRRLVIINPAGEAYRCHGDRRLLGRPFEGAVDLLDDDEPCPSRICPCPYHGIAFARGRPVTVKGDPIRTRLRLLSRGFLKGRP